MRSFERLQELGPNYRYVPESSTSILVIVAEPNNFEQTRVEFAGLNFQVETGSRYLGSLIGEATERDSWIANKADYWVQALRNR